MGETLPAVAKDMDIVSQRLPLGVTAGITPFNFPAMIPLWVSYLILIITTTFCVELFFIISGTIKHFVCNVIACYINLVTLLIGKNVWSLYRSLRFL